MTTNIDLIDDVIWRQTCAGNQWAVDHLTHMNRYELTHVARAERREHATKEAA